MFHRFSGAPATNCESQHVVQSLKTFMAEIDDWLRATRQIGMKRDDDFLRFNTSHRPARLIILSKWGRFARLSSERALVEFDDVRPSKSA